MARGRRLVVTNVADLNTLSTIVGLTLALAGPPLVALFGTTFTRSDSLAAHLWGQAALVGLVVAVLGLTLLWEGSAPAALGLRAPTFATLIWGAAITACFTIIVGPMLLRIPGWLGLAGFERALGDLAKLPIWYLVLAVVVGGVAEEILYRGFAVERLAAITGSDGWAAIIVVALFGAAHLPLWGPGPALTTLISGGLLTAFYLWHGDIGANIIGHIATDLAGIVLPLLRR